MSGIMSRLRSGTTMLAGAGVLVAVLSGCTTPITTGHIDAFDIDYDGSSLTLDIRDHNVSPTDDDVDPATVELHAVADSETTVPSGSQWSFLGDPGDPVWILPQSQPGDLLWPGWDTSDVPAGVFQSDQVTVRLLSVSGPGDFALYTTGSFGTPTIRFNSSDGVPDAFALSRGAHGHANWAFTAAGTYTLTFEAIATLSGGGTVSSGPIDYTFVVGS